MNVFTLKCYMCHGHQKKLFVSFADGPSVLLQLHIDLLCFLPHCDFNIKLNEKLYHIALFSLMFHCKSGCFVKKKSAFCNYFQPSFTYCTAQMCFCLFHTVKLSSGSADDILYLTKKNKTNINVFLIIIINVINITFVLCNRHIGLMGVTYVMSQ